MLGGELPTEVVTLEALKGPEPLFSRLSRDPERPQKFLSRAERSPNLPAVAGGGARDVDVLDVEPAWRTKGDLLIERASHSLGSHQMPWVGDVARS